VLGRLNYVEETWDVFLDINFNFEGCVCHIADTPQVFQLVISCALKLLHLVQEAVHLGDAVF
jgi:hypothetical protein